jgi:hypothetical protein
MLTLEFAKEVIRAKVEEYGTKHFVKDRYAVNGEPHCIVGRVLAEYGVPVEELERIEEMSAHSLTNGANVWSSTEKDYFHKDGLSIEIEPEALLLLNRVQESQDELNNWSETLNYLD